MRFFLAALLVACSSPSDVPEELDLPLPSEVVPEPPTTLSGCQACHGLCEWSYIGHVQSCTADVCVCAFPDRTTARVVWSETVSRDELEQRSRWERHSGDVGLLHHYQH